MLGRGVFFAFILTAATARGAELHTLKGETIRGEIVSVSDKEVVISQGDQRIATPLAQILHIDYNSAGKLSTDAFFDAELTDGSLLHCSKYTINGQEITLQLVAGQEIKLPLLAVSNILTEAGNEKYRKEWSDRLADRKAKMKRRDVVAVRKQGVLNALEGTLGDGDAAAGTIGFTTSSGKTRPVTLAGVAGLVFERAVDPTAAPVVCKIIDTAHDRIEASAVISSKSGGLSVTTPSGAKLELTPALVARLDYSGGKLTWLSDLEPIRVVESFLDNNPFHYKRDHNLEDGPIRLDNVTYSRGLALHATTELEYDLKGDYRELKTVAGIDDLIGGLPGPVILRIEGDGKLLKEFTFDRRDKIRHRDVILNIKDVQKLRVRVAPGGEGLRLDLGLHVDLGDAKVSK